MTTTKTILKTFRFDLGALRCLWELKHKFPGLSEKDIVIRALATMAENQGITLRTNCKWFGGFKAGGVIKCHHKANAGVSNLRIEKCMRCELWPAEARGFI